MSAVKAIYAGIRALGIGEEDERRDLYERVTGKRRLREMSPADKDAVVAELRRLGFRAASPRRMLSGPYAKKLQALWISGWNLGLVRDREDQALVAFVRRQTGIDHTRFLRNPDDATRVVEALKAWLGRDGGVMWGNTNGHDFLKDHVAKVAWAQWLKLHPEASLADVSGFRAAVLNLLDTDRGLNDLTSADWRAVSNALGVTIRKEA